MQFFKHYANMRNDVKINRLIRKYGLEGYGLYNLIVESIVESLSSDHPIPELEETAEDLAEQYRGDTARISEMMQFMLKQGLFEVDEITGRILCRKIYKFIDKSQTRSEEIRSMIESYKTSVCPGQIETVRDFADRSRVEVDKEVEKESRETAFNTFWTLYDKKRNKAKCITLWAKVSPDNYNTIFEHVKQYVASTPEVAYRKDPERYIKYQCWNDEIITGKGVDKNEFEWCHD